MLGCHSHGRHIVAEASTNDAGKSLIIVYNCIKPYAITVNSINKPSLYGVIFYYSLNLMIKPYLLPILFLSTIANFVIQGNTVANHPAEAFAQKTITSLEEIKLVGISVRTNNKDEFDPATQKISACVMKYFHQQLAEQIPNRIKPGVTLCVYTDYESDHTGDYTYFIGEQVSNFDNLPEGFVSLTIPAQKYAKFTTNPGPMPHVVINGWQAIWQMSPQDLGGARTYKADFELYDERAQKHDAVVLDILIGIE